MACSCGCSCCGGGGHGQELPYQGNDWESGIDALAEAQGSSPIATMPLATNAAQGSAHAPFITGDEPGRAGSTYHSLDHATEYTGSDPERYYGRPVKR